MKPIKLNCMHSLSTMNNQLEAHDELAVPYWHHGRPIYEVESCFYAWGRGVESVLFSCSQKSELADYINKKNGFN